VRSVEVRSDFAYPGGGVRFARVGTTRWSGLVYLRVTADERALPGDLSTAVTHYTPDKARELAVRLMDAADLAEQEMAGHEIPDRPQLDIMFVPTS
jgi:hypothetical protein